MKQDLHKGQVWDSVTIQPVSVNIALILSMQTDEQEIRDTMHILNPSSRTTAQIFTRFWTTKPRPCTDCTGDATIALWCQWHPLVAKIGITVFHTHPQGPRSIVSKFHWNQPSSYETTLHVSSLRDCFLQWPQNTLLHTPSAMPPPNPADPLTALIATIAKLLPNQPLILLVTPSFDWNTIEQYDDFQLFWKSVESWFTFQNIPVETPADPTVEPNSTRLEYMLNFLGNTGCKKFDCWKLTGTADEIAKKKKQARAFMDYLSSMMDHTASQHCRIYQLEEVCIWPRESPDELVDHLPNSCWSMQLPNRRGEGMNI